LAFRFVDFFEVRIIGDRFDSLLEWNHLVVTSHNHYTAKFQTLGQVHRADRDLPGDSFDILVE
jgi:hypothetical protein